MALHASPRRFVRTFPNPAVAGEVSISPNAGDIWVVHTLLATLDTDANAADREVVVVADDGTNEYFASPAAAAVAANGLARLSAFPGSQGTVEAGGVLLIAWPTDGVVLFPGNRIRTETAAIQAGDQFSAVTALIDAWSLGAGGLFRPRAPFVIDDATR